MSDKVEKPTRKRTTKPVEMTSTVSSSTTNPDIVETANRTAQANAERLKQIRQAYRLSALQQGNFATATMSDEAIDQSIAIQQTQQAQAQLDQGKSAEEIDALRRSREQAVNLARMHNNYFLGGMTAPYISDEFAYQNPEYVQQVFTGDALALPYAFEAGLGFGTPSIFGAIGNGFARGWQTAGNLATRTGQALRTAGQTVAPVVRNPRVLALTATGLAQTMPMAAEVTNMASGNDGEGIHIVEPLAVLAASGLTWYGGNKALKMLKSPNRKNLYFYESSPGTIKKQNVNDYIKSKVGDIASPIPEKDLVNYMLNEKEINKLSNLERKLQNAKNNLKKFKKDSKKYVSRAENIGSNQVTDDMIKKYEEQLKEAIDLANEEISDFYDGFTPMDLKQKYNLGEGVGYVIRDLPQETKLDKSKRMGRNAVRTVKNIGIAGTVGTGLYEFYNLLSGLKSWQDNYNAQQKNTSSSQSKKEEKKEKKTPPKFKN